jgi:hypothetical protein
MSKASISAAEEGLAIGNPSQTSYSEKSVPESFIKTNKKVPVYEYSETVTIRPFIPQNYNNMGLEKYGYVVFPETYQTENVSSIERNGKIRYITGMDEFSDEVQLIKDVNQKKAVIKNIRDIVSNLEERIGINIVNPDDNEFWNKVKTLRPDNSDFWETVSIKCGNEPVYLEPKKDALDLIKMIVIEAGGFPIIAKSYEDALNKTVSPKWYLDKNVETASTKTEYKKLRNSAIGLLDSMYKGDTKKLLYVAKAIDANGVKYKKNTALDILYDSMDEYIQGNGTERNKQRAAEYFIEIANLDMETLKLKAIVKEGEFYRFIVSKPDGMIYHSSSNSKMGHNVSEVVEYLKNPLHEDILTKLMSDVEAYWN